MTKETVPEQVLSPLELEIMQVIWASGKTTSRQILEAFDERKNAAETKTYERSTIGTYLDRLRLRKYLDREPGEGREFVYFPLVSKEEVQDHTIRRLMESFGSESEFLHRFAGAAKMNPQEQKELRQLAEKLKRKSKS